MLNAPNGQKINRLIVSVASMIFVTSTEKDSMDICLINRKPGEPDQSMSGVSHFVARYPSLPISHFLVNDKICYVINGFIWPETEMLKKYVSVFRKEKRIKRCVPFIPYNAYECNAHFFCCHGDSSVVIIDEMSRAMKSI